MCGLAGFLTIKPGFSFEDAIHSMANVIAHRGPDDEGFWIDKQIGLALGHRRLSILDLSPLGHQPMTSSTGRYVIAFNGEIYNFRQIREEINTAGLDIEWRGHSDTEVILAAVTCWGLETAIKKFIGMFSFALWDKKKQVLSLARDRLGEKPLYYGWAGDSFLFASELKSLTMHPSWQGEINRDAIGQLLKHNYIPAPYSIYQGVFKLLPGTILEIPAPGLSKGYYPSPRPYWNALQAAETGLANPFKGSEGEAVEHLDALLRDAIGQQMVADVPLGAFLSGGIDSTTVVALMQAQCNRPVKTFTIGFNETQYNEAQHALAVAHYLGTDHTELYVTPDEAMEVIPRLASIYDEPFSDSSQIPTLLVSQLAKQHVTVSLSGDGGDELFGGYNRYFWGRDIWRKIGWMPKGLRKVVASGITSLSPQSLDQINAGLQPIMPSHLKMKQVGDKAYKLAKILAVESPEEMYLNLTSHWEFPELVALGSQVQPSLLSDPKSLPSTAGFTHRMMFIDMMSYLPDDILVKVDRASMAVSLESRVPFLDHRVVEFAWRLPLHMKIRETQGKWILKQVLYKYVPEKIMDRPKMGFGVPISLWLRGSLREWAESLLSEKRLREEGFFNYELVRRKWEEHISGKHNWQYYLWDVLMFQAWLDANKN